MIIIIRLHETIGKWYMYQAVQWKPIDGKTWYYLCADGIEDKYMQAEFFDEWSEHMDMYKVAIKVEAEYERETKTMRIGKFIEYVG